MNDQALPHPNADSQPFWAGTLNDELRYQRCPACARAQFPPRGGCIRCGGPLVWAVSAGRGSIHSFTRVERAPSAAFKASVPYVLVLVDIDEGFRLLLTLRDAHEASVAIGQRVRVIFEATADPAIRLPQALREHA